jgi:hypothetical protein
MTYHEIAPFKIKHIALSLEDPPQINTPNFFIEGIEDGKARLSHCIAKTNKVGYYMLDDLYKIHTFGKEYYHERVLSNDWTFSPCTATVATPNGKLFAINCRTTQDKIDPYLY